MCIVVDINALPPVFSERCDKHSDFCHVKTWIEAGKGFLVFGGTSYKRELAKAFRYLRLVRIMKDGGRAVAIRDDVVDKLERVIVQKTAGKDCDDQHLIALLAASHCPLFCSIDSRSFKFVKDRGLYPRKMVRVKVYSSAKNADLLKPMARTMLKNVV